MKKFRVLANVVLLAVTSTLLTAVEAVVARFPSLSRNGYAFRYQETEPNFYK